MLGALRDLAAVLIRIIDYVVPKDREHAVVYTFPGFADMGVAVIENLRYRSIRRITWLVPDDGKDTMHIVMHGAWLKRANQISGIWSYLRAQHVFFTHSLYGASLRWALPPPQSKTVVNLWHGMPIKTIGRLANENRAPQASFAIATSEAFQSIVANAWGTDVSRVLVTGQPWNDRLLSTDEQRRGKIRSQLESPSNVVVWLPTWREGRDGSRDGVPRGNVFGMPGLPDEHFASRLRSLDVLLLVKPHPFAVQVDQPELKDPNIRIIDEPWLRENGLTLYELLSVSDALISDVSSVVVDYVLLDRPVIHAMADLEEYRRSRGFTLGSFDDVQVGPLVDSYDGLLAEIEAVVQGEDRFCDRRRNRLHIWHEYTDARSTERLLDALHIARNDVASD